MLQESIYQVRPYFCEIYLPLQLLKIRKEFNNRSKTKLLNFVIASEVEPSAAISGLRELEIASA
jgi:hypothetical protein